MLVIVEGPDKVGKTTLCKNLSKSLCAPVIKGKRPEEKGKYGEGHAAGYHSAVLEIHRKTKMSMVLDRFHLSEYVYSKLKGRPFDKISWNKVDRELATFDDVILVYLSSTVANITSRVKDDEYISESEVRKLVDLYDEVIKTTAIRNIIRVNTTFFSPRQTLIYTLEEIGQKRIRSSEFYMKLAELCSRRSTCLIRKSGAILVKSGRVIATGYNGAPKGFPHCKTCRVYQKNGPLDWDNCVGVGAAENCIIQVAVHGSSTSGASLYTSAPLSFQDAKRVVNAEVKEVFFKGRLEDSVKEFLASSKIKVVEVV